MNRARRVAVLVALLLAGCRVRDVNGDGTIRVACLGDSNTRSDDVPTWCDHLAARFPRWEVVNFGWGGTVVDNSTFADGTCAAGLDGLVPGCSRYWVEQAIAARPDVAVLAWGTNDALHQIDPTVVVASLVQDYDELQSAGVRVWVATVPDVNSGAFAYTKPYVRETNLRIWESFPPDRVIDFNAIVQPNVAPWYGIHFDEEHQRRRAELVIAALDD
jgi:lysophospholipase L1-like esterase